MKDSAYRVFKELEMGYIPYELSYGLDPSNQIKIDWTALRYDEHRDLDFWIEREDPYLLEQYPCLISWVAEKWEQNKDKTPLEELNERRKNIVEEEKKDDGIKLTITEIDEEEEIVEEKSDNNL
jgi:hypothetical protein